MKVISIVFMICFGGLLHFIYEWSHHNKYVALFAAVNESTWEHIKMALTPMFIWSLVDGYLYGNMPNYFLAKFISLLTVIVAIIILFYSITAITKVPNLILDIVEFVAAIIIAELLFYEILEGQNVSHLAEYVGCVGEFIIFAIYMSMTMLPIEGFLFIDPVTEKYGIEGHPEEEEVEAWEKAKAEEVKSERKKRKRRRRRKSNKVKNESNE